MNMFLLFHLSYRPSDLLSGTAALRAAPVSRLIVRGKFI